MKKTKHLGISGGGFAISGLAGAAEQVLKSGFKPDVVSGVSSGSILTFVIAGSKDPLKVIRDNATGFNADAAFTHSPINKKGKLTLRAIWNALTKNYFAKQDKLEDTLKKLVSKEEWDAYRKDPNGIDAIIIAVDFVSGARLKFNLKNETYEDAIKLVRASSSIPVFVEPVYYKYFVLYDGGVRNHIATEWVIDNYKDIEETVSIFSRPEDFNDLKPRTELKSTYKVLMRTIEIMEYEISKNDEALADLKCQYKNIKSTNIFLPSLLNSTYDIDHEKQIALYNAGKENAKAKGF